jgi:hypothetical protein
LLAIWCLRICKRGSIMTFLFPCWELS